MHKTIKVLVTSSNPNKVKGTKRAFLKFLKATSQKARLIIKSKKFPSNVAEQPVGHYETMLGSLNRVMNAKNADKEKYFDYYVGIESGVVFLKNHPHILSYACVMDKNNRFFFGTSMMFPLPSEATNYIKQGKEIAEFAEKVSKTKDIRSKGGIVSFLSNQQYNRIKINSTAVFGALIGFIKPQLFKPSSKQSSPIIYISTSISSGVVKNLPLIIAKTVEECNGYVNNPHVIYAGHDNQKRDLYFEQLTKKYFNKIPPKDDLLKLSELVYKLDALLVDQATHLIALLDNPSFGVGMEIERALTKPQRGLHETKILGLIHKNNYAKTSKMILGAQSKNFIIRAYETKEDVVRVVREFLGE